MSRTALDVVRTREFDRNAKKIWTTHELTEVIQQLAMFPNSGKYLGRGLYKTRVAASGRGKRGGARVIYLLVTDRRTIYLLAAYAKNEKADLTSAELKLLRKFAERLGGTE